MNCPTCHIGLDERELIQQLWSVKACPHCKSMVRKGQIEIDDAIKAEREACAKIAESYKADDPETVRNINYRLAIAAAIRERK